MYKGIVKLFYLARISKNLHILLLYLCLATTSVAAGYENEIHPLDMVFVPGGEYQIGSLVSPNTQPIHSVKVESFYISKYEVTFAEYDLFTSSSNKDPRYDLGWGRGRNPVIDVSWFDAVEYAQWLSKKTGFLYRLPTEAEWEYVARSQSKLSAFHWGDSVGINHANCRNCGSEGAGEKTMSVGSFEPNSLGVYDLHGNVWEWTSNCYSESYYETVVSYIGVERESESNSCRRAMIRGGSWDTHSDSMKVWNRVEQLKNVANSDIGIRLVRELNSSELDNT